MPKLMAEYKNFFGAGGAPEWERDAMHGQFLEKFPVLNALDTVSNNSNLASDMEPWYFKNHTVHRDHTAAPFSIRTGIHGISV